MCITSIISKAIHMSIFRNSDKAGEAGMTCNQQVMTWFMEARF